MWGVTAGLSLGSAPFLRLALDGVGWRPISLVVLPFALAAGALGAWAIGETGGSPPRRSDLPGVLLATPALFALGLGLINAASGGFGQPLTIVSLGAAVVFGAGFAVREALAARPMLPPALIGAATLPAATIIIVFAWFAITIANVYFVIVLQQFQGLSAIRTGLRMLPLAVAAVAAAPITGLLADRRGHRPLLLVMLPVNAVAMLGVYLAGPERPPYFLLLPLLVLIGLTYGSVTVAAAGALLGATPRELAGAGGGVQEAGAQLGGLIGGVVIGRTVAGGAISSATESLRTVLLVSAIAALAGAVVALFVRVRADHEQEHARQKAR